jgi:putative PIN family toxin of toxin-antitoxin system
MRVVLDTNVLLSGFIWTGPPFKIIDAWKNERFELIVTPDIVSEYERTLKEFAKGKNKVDYLSVLALITSKALWASPATLPIQICDDPDDDIFIAAAIGGEADFIVTGDSALLRGAVSPPPAIVKPREFLETHV